MTLSPVILHKCKCCSSVEWVISDWHLAALDFRVPEEITPIIDVANFYPQPRDDHGGAAGGCGQRENQELAIIAHKAMSSLPRLHQPRFIGFAGTLAQSRMFQHVINIVEVFIKARTQFRQRQHRLLFRIDAPCNLPDVTHNLGVSLQIVYELGIAGAKKAFDDRTKPSFGSGASLLDAFIASQQRFEIDAAKFGAAVDHENLRNSGMTGDTFPNNHHASTIAGWIER